MRIKHNLKIIKKAPERQGLFYSFNKEIIYDDM